MLPEKILSLCLNVILEYILEKTQKNKKTNIFFAKIVKEMIEIYIPSKSYALQTQLADNFYQKSFQIHMNQFCMLCPCCQLSVGFLNCCTCQEEFRFEKCNGLPVPCPTCREPILDTYYQIEEDILIHANCWRNQRRMFYICGKCDGHFCRCVEKQLKKSCILAPCPMKRCNKKTCSPV